MWCYQKPGFEALLLAELQRQQQHSQFCDTLLKAEGVSVPAHSCVLSAISPHVSSALSSMPAPPAGQSRLLEFRHLGACTLLHMVRLLYSGEMAGEGEKEKQEAISAAAKLGIHGLVEVTKRDRKILNEERGGEHTEVGVQTEPLMVEENEGRRGKWRREVRDGSTILWRETLSDGEKDMWTQIEELQVNTAPAPHSESSFETNDMAAPQGLGQMDFHVVPPQIPYIPRSLDYPLEENQTPQPPSASAASTQDSTAAEHTSVPVVAPSNPSFPPPLMPFSSQMTLCATDAQSWCPGLQEVARDVGERKDREDESLKQFQGDIPGFISYFLSTDKEAGPHRGWAGREGRGAATGGARKAGRAKRSGRAGRGEKQPRRLQARSGRRGRGGLTQKVDAQEVGLSRLQKRFLQRWGMRTSRTGQGGGAVGRKLYLKTRELLRPAKSCQRRRRHGTMWDFSQSGDVLPHSKHSLPVSKAQRSTAKTTSVSFSSTQMRFYNIHNLSASSAALQPSPSPILLAPAASFVPPASSLLQTTSLPPPAPPPDEDQPEHIDRLLEEVMIGLNILPINTSNSASHSQPLLPTSRSSSLAYTSSGKQTTQNKQQGCTTGLMEAGPGFHGSTQVVGVARGASGSSSTNSEIPILLQQGEEELNNMLDHFLQSFEKHVGSCSVREEDKMDGESFREASKPYNAKKKYRETKAKTPHSPHLRNTRKLRSVISSKTTESKQSDKAEIPPSCSQPCKAFARSAAPPKHAAGSLVEVRASKKPPNKRRKSQYLISLERKRVRKPVSASDAETKILHNQGDKQLLQMPVVKLERSGSLPVRGTLQGHNCQSPEVKSPAEVKTSSSSVECPCRSLSEKKQPGLCRKIYPTRSRFRKAHMDSLLSLEDPLVDQRSPSAGQPGSRRGRSKKNGQLLSLSDGWTTTSTIPLQPVEPCCTNEQLEKNQERHQEEKTVQQKEEAERPIEMGMKRGAESAEERSTDATVAKRIRFEQIAQLACETCRPSSEFAGFVSKKATSEAEDEIDVETLSLTSEGHCLQSEIKTVWREILQETEKIMIDEEMQGSEDEILDVDGDTDGKIGLEEHTDDCREQAEEDCCQSRTAPPLLKSFSPPSHSEKEDREVQTGSWDDNDVDVIGGSSPVPDPVIISWTESTEGEEEDEDKDIDVVGEETDNTSWVMIATMNNSELVNRKDQTELLLH